MPVSSRVRVLAVAAAAATAVSLGVAGVAYADGTIAKVCADFPNVADAQVALDAEPSLNAALDVELGGADNDVACDEPAVEEHDSDDSDDDSDHPECDDFDEQKDAQKALDKDEDLAKYLDRDGDGVACEGLRDEDNDDDGDHHKKRHDDGDDNDHHDGGQVRVHPSGGVDTGGAA